MILAKDEKDFYLRKFCLDEVVNFEDYLFEYDLSRAKTVLAGIVEEWESKKELTVLEKENLLISLNNVYSALVANIESMDEDLLAYHLRLEKVSLQNFTDAEIAESALEYLNQRIRLANKLLDVKKYKLAKYVIEEKIDNLLTHLDQTTSSIQDYLALLKKNLDIKIAYIEENLHGSANIVEENYQEFYLESEAAEAAYQLLKNYADENTSESIEENQVKEDAVIFVFTRNHILLLPDEIERIGDLSDKFLIQKATTENGIIFSGKFNASSNALYEIQVGDQKIDNSILISEVNEALKYVPQTVENEGIEVISSDEETVQITGLAFELRIKTAIKLLEKIGIKIEKSDIIKNQEANIFVQTKINEIRVNFILDEVEKTVFELEVSSYGTIEGEIGLDDLITTVEDFVKTKEREKNLEAIQLKFDELNFMFDERNITEFEEQKYQIKSIYDQKNAILFDAIYDLVKDVFVEVDLGERGIFINLQGTKLVDQITRLKEAELEVKITEQIRGS